MLSFKTCIFYHLLRGVLIPLICPFQFILLTQLPKHIPRFIVMSPLLTHFGLINLLHSLVRWLLFFLSTSYTKVILRFCHCESWYIWFLKLVLVRCRSKLLYSPWGPPSLSTAMFSPNPLPSFHFSLFTLILLWILCLIHFHCSFFTYFPEQHVLEIPYYQLRLLSSPRTQASQLMSPLPLFSSTDYFWSI